MAVERQSEFFYSAQVVREDKRGNHAICVPTALVRMAGMQPGPLTVESEAGDKWQSNLSDFNPNGGSFRIRKGWPLVVAALQLEAGRTICLAALSPSRLLVSRQGEPHFSAAASSGGKAAAGNGLPVKRKR